VEREADAMAEQGYAYLCQKLVAADQHSLDHPDLDQGLVSSGCKDDRSAASGRSQHACLSVGIQVKMITGDHALTAGAIARMMELNQTDEVLAFTGQN